MYGVYSQLAHLISWRMHELISRFRLGIEMDAGAVSDWGRGQGSSLGMDAGAVSDMGTSTG